MTQLRPAFFLHIGLGSGRQFLLRVGDCYLKSRSLLDDHAVGVEAAQGRITVGLSTALFASAAPKMPIAA